MVIGNRWSNMTTRAVKERREVKYFLENGYVEEDNLPEIGVFFAAQKNLIIRVRKIELKSHLLDSGISFLHRLVERELLRRRVSTAVRDKVSQARPAVTAPRTSLR
jgi:hypothetical protein